MMDSMVVDPLAYSVLRLSLIEHRCPPSQLTLERREALRAQASMARKIEAWVLASELAKRVSMSDDEIEAAKAELAECFESEAHCRKVLEEERIDETMLRAGLYQAIWVERVMSLVRSEVPYPDPSKVSDYYQSNPLRFERPERRTLSQILITINDEYDENRFDVAKARLTSVHQLLLDDASLFADLALKHSECPSALKGGHMGEFEAGQLYPELDAVAFTLAEGEISAVIETELGFHLLRCETIAPARKLAFEEVCETLGHQLWTHAQRQHERAWLASLADAKN
jgi:nitrogen fixation protein NifM